LLRYWYHLHPKPVQEIHEFWKNHPDPLNDPHFYATNLKASADFLANLLRHYVPPEGRVLEIGCNVGRNLNAVFQAGYRNLQGIELNPKAVELMKEYYPDMARAATIHVGLVEELIGTIGAVDCIYTTGVLEHIHSKSNWIFPELVKRASTIITIEAEKSFGWRWFPRNYKRVFESLGMQQVEEIENASLPSSIAAELENFTTRVFQKGTEARANLGGMT